MAPTLSVPRPRGGSAPTSIVSLPDLLSDLLPAVRLVFVRELWSCIKNAAQLTVTGWLAESWFLEICRTLEKFGIRTIRGAESSACDGAWIYDPSNSADLPLVGSTSLELFEWANEHPDTELLYFDVKYFSLRPSAKAELDYAYSTPDGTALKDDAAVYVVVIESLTDYVALIPKYVFENATDFGYGVEPLICGMPAWCLHFLVHVEDLAEAIQGLLGAKESQWYRNPTTGLVFTGWIPQRLADPRSLKPGQQRKITSMTAILYLLGMIKAEGWDMDFNPVAPLICDFWIWCKSVEHLQEPIFIEHKAMDNYFFTGVDSPFGLDRQWHFLICSRPDVERMFCCARQAADESWIDLEHLDNDVYESFCHDSIESLLKYIAENAAAAAAESERLGSRQNHSTERNLASIISRESREAAAHSDRTTGERTTQSARAPKDRVFQAKGLPWVCLALNNLFAEQRHLVCYPVDPYHPSGADHLVVDHVWSDDDLARLKLGQLPFSPLIGKTRTKAVAMRFADCSGGFGASEGQPIVMRPSYWTRPCPSVRGVMLLGAVLPPEVYTKGNDSSWRPYVLIPAQRLSSYFSDEMREPVPKPADDAACRERDKLFFNSTPQAESELLHGVRFSGSHPKSLKKNSVFVTEDFDPLTNVIDFGALPAILLELLRGSAPEMSIQSPLVDGANQLFTKAENITDVRAFHQAAWDYSLWRKPAAVDGKPADRQRVPADKSRARDPSNPQKGGTHRKTLGRPN